MRAGQHGRIARSGQATRHDRIVEDDGTLDERADLGHRVPLVSVRFRVVCAQRIDGDQDDVRSAARLWGVDWGGRVPLVTAGDRQACQRSRDDSQETGADHVIPLARLGVSVGSSPARSRRHRAHAPSRHGFILRPARPDSRSCLAGAFLRARRRLKVAADRVERQACKALRTWAEASRNVQDRQRAGPSGSLRLGPGSETLPERNDPLRTAGGRKQWAIQDANTP